MKAKILLVMILCISVGRADTLNILVLGQSNMNGTLGSLVKVDMPLELKTGMGTRLSRTYLTWRGAPVDPNGYHLHIVKPYSYNLGIWGPEVFGGWRLASLDHDTIITKATGGGVPIGFFEPGNAGWDLMVSNYGKTLSEGILLGLDDPGVIDVLWWGQGEQLTTPPGNYLEDLTGLIESIKEEFASPDMKVVFMGLGRNYAEDYESDLAFKSYVAEHPGRAIYVGAKDIDLRIDHVAEYPSESVGGPHYSAIGMKALGIRMAMATKALTVTVEDIYEKYKAEEATLELGMDSTIRGEVDGSVALSVQMMVSDDLDGWVPAGDALDWIFPAGSKEFFRFEVSK